MKKIRWAVCGLGGISKKFIKEARAVEGVEIAACLSSSSERAKKYALKNNIPNFGVYSDIEKIPGIDAVYVCNNMSDHYKSALYFLSKNYPVLCEKALAQNYAEAEKMISFAKEKNVLLMDAMKTPFNPVSQRVFHIARSEELGRVVRMEGAFAFFKRHRPNSRIFDNSRGGGTILDMAVYPVYYGHYIAGEPQKIDVCGRVRKGVDVESRMSLEYAGGIKAEYFTGVLGLLYKNYFNIYFERGAIKVPDFLTAKKFKIIKDGKTQSVKIPRRDPFYYEIEHFSQLVREGKNESPIVSHADTLCVMKTLHTLNEKQGVHFKTKE